MSKDYDDVRAFHCRFGQLDPGRPVHLTRRKLRERANFMLEELDEFATGAGLERVDDGYIFSDWRDQDLAGQADALVDLVYVALGTAAMLGLPWDALWADVQRANMAKVKGPTHRAMGYGADIAKPEGWVGPRTVEILTAAGYSRALFEREGRVNDARCHDDPEAPR
jgi:predicted HAD superfamily Cof-like phosphohydrolase